jgi:hypothetical protein
MPSAPSKKTELIVGVPTRDLITHPLWVASEGNIQELVTLELSSKHLLRRGMAEGLKIIPLHQKEGRTLVVVLAPTTTPSALTAPYLKNADHFEAAARLLAPSGADLMIWRELGEICFGFLQNDHFIWFSGSGETEANSFLLGLIRRMAFHFQAERVLEKMPQSMRLLGSFSQEERTLLQSAFQELPHVSEERASDSLPVPFIPTPLLDLPPQEARGIRLLEEKRERIKKAALLALLGYFVLLLLGGANLLQKEYTLQRLNHQFGTEKSAVDKAADVVTEWQEFRGAFDPSMYALDLLASIASNIHGEKIRLITLAASDGKVLITGEAIDVSQAYHFIESIKKAPELEEYEWTSGQPKLAGKSSVRFEIEGSLPHATTSPE